MLYYFKFLSTKWVISVTILLCGINPIVAQINSKNIYLNSEYRYGIILPEYSSFNLLANSPARGLAFSIGKQTLGSNEWQQIYGFPKVGLTFLYSSLGNDDVFGKEYGIYPFFEAPIISNKSITSNYQIGVGLTYVDKKFDLNNNYQNIAVGSNINLNFNFKINLGYKFQNGLEPYTGLNFHHFSNGNFSEPNLGLNAFSSLVGINYYVGKQTQPKIKELEAHKPSFEKNIIIAFGGKHARALASKYYATSSATFELRRKLKRVFNMSAGFDVFFDSSTEVEMIAKGKSNFKPINNYRTGIHVSQELVYNKLSLIIQEGIYIGLTNKIDSKTIYNRGMIRYKFNNGIMTTLSLKSHLHILDYPEFGIGYYWK